MVTVSKAMKAFALAAVTAIGACASAPPEVVSMALEPVPDEEPTPEQETVLLEGVLRHQLEACDYPAEIRQFGQVLSERAMLAFALKERKPADSIRALVEDGLAQARATSSDGAADMCGQEQDACRLMVMEQREHAVAAFLATEPTIDGAPLPESWPLNEIQLRRPPGWPLVVDLEGCPDSDDAPGDSGSDD